MDLFVCSVFFFSAEDPRISHTAPELRLDILDQVLPEPKNWRVTYQTLGDERHFGAVLTVVSSGVVCVFFVFFVFVYSVSGEVFLAIVAYCCY